MDFDVLADCWLLFVDFVNEKWGCLWAIFALAAPVMLAAIWFVAKGY